MPSPLSQALTPFSGPPRVFRPAAANRPAHLPPAPELPLSLHLGLNIHPTAATRAAACSPGARRTCAGGVSLTAAAPAQPMAPSRSRARPSPAAPSRPLPRSDTPKNLPASMRTTFAPPGPSLTGPPASTCDSVAGKVCSSPSSTVTTAPIAKSLPLIDICGTCRIPNAPDEISGTRASMNPASSVT